MSRAATRERSTKETSIRIAIDLDGTGKVSVSTGVPFAPGGGTDIIARVTAQKVSDAWGQPIVVENRPGAAGGIGAEAVFKSPADGYTLMTLGATLAGNYWLVKTPYDAIKDVGPIATLLSYENVLVVPPSLPVSSLADLVALAKARPNQLTYGTSSTGGPTHLLAELFNTTAGIKTRHIPYKGGGPALTDVIAGQIQVVFATSQTGLPQAKAGRLRVLGVTTPYRIAAEPDLPTIAEAGLKGYSYVVWYGLWFPAGTPNEYVTRMRSEVVKALDDPETKKAFADQGFVGVGSTRSASAVRWGLASSIVYAWILTIPCSAFIAGLAWWIVTHAF